MYCWTGSASICRYYYAAELQWASQLKKHALRSQQLLLQNIKRAFKNSHPTDTWRRSLLGQSRHKTFKQRFQRQPLRLPRQRVRVQRAGYEKQALNRDRVITMPGDGFSMSIRSIRFDFPLRTIAGQGGGSICQCPSGVSM